MHNTNNTIAPYSAPNPIDTLQRLEIRLHRKLPLFHYRIAEIIACLQTLDDGVRELESKSAHRTAAAATWRELAGDLLDAIPVNTIKIGWRISPIDPFEVARRDFKAGGTRHAFRKNLPEMLKLMTAAANIVIGPSLRYVDNYHGVICVQLAKLGLISESTCVAFHRVVIKLPMPDNFANLGLVYSADYSPDELPRGCEDHFDLSDYVPPRIMKKITEKQGGAKRVHP